MRFISSLIAVTSALLCAPGWAQEEAAADQPLSMTVLEGNQTAELVTSSRAYYFVPRHKRGKTKPIPEHVVINFCGDFDGCKGRIGMYNWDNTGRIASREFLFFYNPINKNWRVSSGDIEGSNQDNVTQHINNAWSCYFTDGKYDKFQNHDDPDLYFGLLSWNQYNAGCLLTLID